MRRAARDAGAWGRVESASLSEAHAARYGSPGGMGRGVRPLGILPKVWALCPGSGRPVGVQNVWTAGGPKKGSTTSGQRRAKTGLPHRKKGLPLFRKPVYHISLKMGLPHPRR